jgi:hypothetical protein
LTAVARQVAANIFDAKSDDRHTTLKLASLSLKKSFTFRMDDLKRRVFGHEIIAALTWA